MSKSFMKYQDFVDPKRSGKYQSIVIFDVDDTLVVTKSQIKVIDTKSKLPGIPDIAEFIEVGVGESFIQKYKSKYKI